MLAISGHCSRWIFNSTLEPSTLGIIRLGPVGRKVVILGGHKQPILLFVWLRAIFCFEEGQPG